MSVSVWRGAVYPPLKINRNRRTAERSARLKPAILTGNRMEQRRCRQLQLNKPLSFIYRIFVIHNTTCRHTLL